MWDVLFVLAIIVLAVFAGLLAIGLGMAAVRLMIHLTRPVSHASITLKTRYPTLNYYHAVFAQVTLNIAILFGLYMLWRVYFGRDPDADPTQIAILLYIVLAATIVLLPLCLIGLYRNLIDPTWQPSFVTRRGFRSSLIRGKSLALKLSLFCVRHIGKIALVAAVLYAISVILTQTNIDPAGEISVVGGAVLAVWRTLSLGVLFHSLGAMFISPGIRGDAEFLIGLARVSAFVGLFLLSCWFAFAVVALVLALLQRLLTSPEGARFATFKEVSGARNQAGSAFGYHGGRLLRLLTDKHVLIMASTRSGKGVALIIPHLLRYPGSAFVLDPKGENARATGRRRGRLNDKVHYLDPFGISGKPRSRFNPLSRFTPENMEAESKALAGALFASVERDHWSGSAQQLLASFILYVFTAPDIPPENKDLNTVRRLLLGAVYDTLNTMKDSTVADGLLSDLAASFLITPPGEFGSIVSNAQRETEILDNPFIKACLAASGDGEEVDFADWHRGTMTVYLCLSAPKFPVFNRWLRLVLTSALDEMTDRLDPPPLPVCFMLDELATLGHLAAVENAVGLAAGYGVQLFTVFQDVAQMRDLYKGRWASFIGNAGVRALFNLDDYDTAHYWSDFLGGRVIQTMSQSENLYGITDSFSAGEATQPLVTPDEIMRRYTAGKMLVLPQGARPIEADRVPYFEDSELVGLWDDPRGPVPAPPAPVPVPRPVATSVPDALPSAAS
jgi:type IV secretion system protein VirD4